MTFHGLFVFLLPISTLGPPRRWFRQPDGSQQRNRQKTTAVKEATVFTERKFSTSHTPVGSSSNRRIGKNNTNMARTHPSHPMTAAHRRSFNQAVTFVNGATNTVTTAPHNAATSITDVPAPSEKSDSYPGTERRITDPPRHSSHLRPAPRRSTANDTSLRSNRSVVVPAAHSRDRARS